MESLQRASDFRHHNTGLVETDHNSVGNYGMPTPGGSGYDGSYYNSPSVMDGGNDHSVMAMDYGATFAGASGANVMHLDGVGTMNGYDMGIPDDNVDFSSLLEVPADAYLIDSTRRIYVSPQPTFPTPGNNGASSSHSFVAQSKSSSTSRGFEQGSSRSRERSVRKASIQASEGMSAYLRDQKEEDKEFGYRSSEEDSQVSEFQGSEDEFI